MIQLVGVSLAALVVLMLGELVPDAGAASDAASAEAGPPLPTLSPLRGARGPELRGARGPEPPKLADQPRRRGRRDGRHRDDAAARVAAAARARTRQRPDGDGRRDRGAPQPRSDRLHAGHARQRQRQPGPAEPAAARSPVPRVPGVAAAGRAAGAVGLHRRRAPQRAVRRHAELGSDPDRGDPLRQPDARVEPDLRTEHARRCAVAGDQDRLLRSGRRGPPAGRFVRPPAAGRRHRRPRPALGRVRGGPVFRRGGLAAVFPIAHGERVRRDDLPQRGDVGGAGPHRGGHHVDRQRPGAAPAARPRSPRDLHAPRSHRQPHVHGGRARRAPAGDVRAPVGRRVLPRQPHRDRERRSGRLDRLPGSRPGGLRLRQRRWRRRDAGARRRRQPDPVRSPQPVQRVRERDAHAAAGLRRLGPDRRRGAGRGPREPPVRRRRRQRGPGGLRVVERAGPPVAEPRRRCRAASSTPNRASPSTA